MDGPGRIIYAVMILAMIVPAYLALRGDHKKETKNLIIWVIAFAILALGWQAFH